MASLFKDKHGNMAIQFLDRERKRRTLRIGHVSRKTADAVRGHVEHLVNARQLARPAPQDTVAWVASLGDDTHAKLVKCGLADPRASAAPVARLAATLDAYLKRRTDLKPRTIANLTQARNGLVAHFGADRDVRTINRGEVADWHRGIKARLAGPTVAMHVKKARQMFADALDRNLVTENPVKGIKAGGMANDERFHYVSVAEIRKVIECCPDAEWKLVFALARFGGLRIPSEIRTLRWSDVDWAGSRLTVRATKTEHQQKKGRREMPIFPELLPFLRDAFDAAEEGATNVVTRHRGENLRTTGRKIVRRAGLDPWGKLFQNLRSSCETDLAGRFPLHVACAWVGNTEAVARRHYLQVTDEHFAAAIGNGAAPGAAEADRSPPKQPAPERKNPAFLRGFAGKQYPQGESNKGRNLADSLGVTPKALRQALRRLKTASPREHRNAVLRLRTGGAR